MLILSMIKVIIIDDEPHARDYLEKVIDNFFNGKILVLAKCKNIAEAIENIDLLKPDIVFLDIHLHHENGFELLRNVKSINFEIIFTTAHAEFAIEAIKWNALDYLLKPIDHIELLESIKKYEKRQLNKIEFNRLQLLLENMNCDEASNSKIAFPIESGYKIVKVGSIMYCQADINYTRIFLNNGTDFIISKTLKIVEELLPKDFFIRAHKSFLFNLNYAVGLNRGVDSYIELFGGVKIPVSTRKKEDVIKKVTHKI